MNGELKRMIGTVNYEESDPTKRAVISSMGKIEDRKFESYMRYWPIPQAQMEKNPQLVQNIGYE